MIDQETSRLVPACPSILRTIDSHGKPCKKIKDRKTPHGYLYVLGKQDCKTKGMRRFVSCGLRKEWGDLYHVGCISWRVKDDACEMSWVSCVCEMSCMWWYGWVEFREISCVRWVVRGSCVRWVVWVEFVWDELCEMMCEMSWGRRVVGDEFVWDECVMSQVRRVAWDESSEKSCVRGGVGDEWCGRWAVWHELREMSCVT